MNDEWPDTGLRIMNGEVVGVDKGLVPVVEEMGAMIGQEVEDGLEDEIALVRAAMSQAMLMMKEGELDALALYRVSRVVIQGAGMVATLLRTKQILAGDADEEMLGVMGAVIEELFEENGWGGGGE